MRPISVTLAELASARGISAREIARRGGTTQQNVQRVLTDPLKVPRADTLAAVARGLGLSPAQLGRLVMDHFPAPDRAEK
jgi:transcriptional regulator with XRE-family HTH domain